MELQLDRPVGDGHSPYIVAEIGQNHNGDVYAALRMIDMAVRCGVDAVKFQLRNADAEFPAAVLDAPHPNPQNAFGDTYRDHRHALDLTAAEISHLADRIRYNDWPIAWFCTPCWVGAVEQLERLAAPFYKIASKDLANHELLCEVAKTAKPVILSTGMHGFREIGQALDIVGTDVIVLQCTSRYPCPPESVNLRRMGAIRDEFGVLVGYSDHTAGTAVCGAAVALGACLIEKHVTLSRQMKGTDHACSADEADLARIVAESREIRAAC